VSRLLSINATVALITEECCNCHMVFAVPRDFYEQARNNTEVWFYCPRGHQQHYSKSRLAELQEEVNREKDFRQQAERRAREIAKERDHHWTERKKLKTRHTHLIQRVKNGVCPCCHRSFVNMQRHIASEHPGFTANEDGGAQ